MSYQILIEHDGRILRVRYSGQIGIEERIAAAEAVLGRRTHASINRYVLDYRGATYLPGDEASNRALARYLADMLAGRDARIAWLMNYDHQLGPSVERLTGDFGVTNGRFYNIESAMAWLLQPADAMRPMMGSAPEAPSPPRRALALAMGIADPSRPLPPTQFAGVTRLVQDLLDEGLDEATVQRLAGRMFEVVYAAAATPAPSSSARD